MPESEQPPATGFQLRFWWLAMLSALTLALGVITPWLLPNTRPEVAVTPSVSSTSARPLPPADPSLPTLQAGVPVYFVGRSDGLLYREYWNLATVSDRVTTAVVAAINQQPKDPTYTSLWAQGQVNSVKVSSETITVDLSANVFSAWQDRTGATRAINQVVYTALANVGDRAGALSVTVLSDGSPNLPIIGKPAAPFTTSGLAPLGLLWVRTPEYGAQLPSGQIALTGFLQPDQGSLVNYRVSAAGNSSTALLEGVVAVTAAAGQTWLTWTINVELPAGAYQVTVTATGTVSQTKLFTLT